MDFVQCTPFGTTLDCSSRNLVTVPNYINYSPYLYVSFQDNKLVQASLKDYPLSTVFDLRRNPSLQCSAVSFNPGQTVYPCNYPDHRKNVTKNDTSADSDSDDSARKDRNSTKVKIIFLCLGLFFGFSLLSVFAYLLYKYRVNLRRRVNGELTVLIVEFFKN